MPVDVSLDHSVDPLGATSSAAFAPSAAINTADALTAAQVTQAMELGAKVADTNIEAGTDLFLLGDLGRGSTAVAATVISIIIDVEPLKCVGRGSGIEDEAWMRKMSAVRDARRRAVPHRRDSHELLRICGGADFAAAVGFLLRACERRIPVILDGVVGAAVALLTHQLNPEAHRSWQVARNSDEPAQKIAINALGLRPILELTLPFGEGIGALLALAVLQGAATLAEADRN
jgi:nicotinate-nucleotide--dimethylbenzimidazole phosphoribosyltransferase